MVSTKPRSFDPRADLPFRFWKSFRALFGLALLVVLTLNACGQSQSLQPLKVGVTTWPGFDIILYAQEAGIFKQRGLEVQLIRFENQQDSARAVLRGSLDASFSSLWDVMQVDPGEDKPEVLLVSNISAGSDGMVARSGIQSIKDLPGKRVGAKLGTVNHLILLEALKLHQIPPEAVTIEDVSNETAVELLRKGKLDAAVVWQPLLGETATAINGKIIFTTAEVDSLVIDTLMSRSSVVKAKSAELVRFMQSWFDVMHAVDTQPTDVYDRVGQALGQTGASFGSDYAGLKKGDIAMQQRMFQSASRLKAAIAQMAQLLQADPRSGRVPREDLEINSALVTSAMATWNP
ncbi:ABC transporter substrate-binding protein [Pantanalinema rosaneae CENA516]|uniref:ABC transporter substrate-binding protein n=1 Tax=Pantanalinema rosaneae TaxID=1620701 RepID=UPI003D6DB439